MKQLVAESKDYVFFLKLMPIIQIHPDAYKKAKAIACEKSNEKALGMLEDAYAGKDVGEPACETAVIDDNIALGKKLDITGTPTIILPNGRKTTGAPSVDDLKAMMNLK